MRNILFLILVLILVLGCQKSIDDLDLINSINSKHLLIREASLKDQEQLLFDARVLLRAGVVPDSVKTEHYYLNGLYFTEIGSLDSAAVYFQKAINLIESGPLSERQVTYFYNAWDTYLDKQEYGACIATNTKYKTLLEENNDARLTSIAHSLDKTIYLRRKEYRKALESSSEQIKYLKQTSDTNAIVSALISRTKILDDVYDDRNEVFLLLDSLVERKNDFTPGINRMLFGQYGVHLFYEEEFAKASDYFSRGLTYAKQIEDPATRRKRTSNIYNNLAEVSLILKRYDQAGAYLDTLSEMDITTLEQRQQRAYLVNKFQLAANTNKDTKDVLKSLDALNSHQNRTYQEKYTKDLEALKIANENEKLLESEKQQAEFKNFRLQTTLIVVAVGVVLLGLIGVLFYRQKKFGLERENLLTQQRLLRAQMNPHFTFNTLTVIRDMIDKNPSDAKNYLVKFSRLLASIFENSTFNYVLLEKELEALRQYMDLQKIRFPKSFEYRLELNDIETDLLYVPGMLLQPIIENSINHGFMDIDYFGKITISLKEDGSFIRCEIEDNGKGIDINKPVSRRISSTKLIKAFIEKVTQEPFTVVNKKDIFEEESGVKVNFLIPFKEQLDD